jgi:hypothetical protein
MALLPINVNVPLPPPSPLNGVKTAVDVEDRVQYESKIAKLYDAGVIQYAPYGDAKRRRIEAENQGEARREGRRVQLIREKGACTCMRACC